MWNRVKLLLKKIQIKKLFIVSFIYTIQVKEFILAGKLLYRRFSKIFNERPSGKSAHFELDPPHDLPKLNERPGRALMQQSLNFLVNTVLPEVFADWLLNLSWNAWKT